MAVVPLVVTSMALGESLPMFIRGSPTVEVIPADAKRADKANRNNLINVMIQREREKGC